MSYTLHGIGVVTVGDDDVRIASATADVNGLYYEALGTSRRDPNDKPSDDIGERLALGRAIRKLGRDILRDVQDDIREKARKEEIARDSQRQALENRKARLSRPLVQEADPEIERLLAEEEAIESARQQSTIQTTGFIAGVRGR